VRWFFVLGVDICHVTLVLQPDDITVEMRDGLLSLKIQFPPPSSEDDSQEIAIR
jgi:hypothetical protein